jgi:hypothetical protein
MTELKKLTKIALIAYAIVTLLYGILLTFLLDIFLTPMTGWTNPLHPRNFGAICLLSSLFAIIVFRKNNWEESKLIFVFMFSFFIPVLIIELGLLPILIPTLSEAAISQTILDTILVVILLSLGVVSYLKQK